MRTLLPGAGSGDTDVHAHYAQGWVEGGGVRVNFVAAVDGAVAAAGTSRGLQTPGDNRVYAALRDLADVVLVGSGTAMAEKYGPARFSDARAAKRRAYGFAETMPIAVLTRSLRLDPSAPLFADPSRRPLVLTCAAAPADRRAAIAGIADVVDCGTEDIDPQLVRGALVDRGLRRILCEGGPTIFAHLAEAGVVDELCLSISPLLGGPGAGRITGGDEWSLSVPLRMVGLLEEDGALFCRYRTAAPDPSAA